MTEPDDDLEEAPARRRWIPIAAVAVLLAAGLGIGLGVGLSGGSSAPAGPEGVPVQNVADLASADSTVKGTPVDGFIPCVANMDPNFHIHVHLAIFVNGVQERIPAGAGVIGAVAEQQPGGTYVDAGSSGCEYWLHTHAADGIIHVEAPAEREFTLKEFFDVWGQPLSSEQVGPARGPVVAFVNGKRITGDPGSIPLLNHDVVQLDVGTPVVPFKPLKFNVTGGCSLRCSAVPTTT